MNTLYYDRFDSPIGALTVAVDQVGVRHILFAENRHDAKGRELWRVVGAIDWQGDEAKALLAEGGAR